MGKEHKGFEITTDGFNESPDRDASIAKVIVKSKDQRNIFFFAVPHTLMDIKKFKYEDLLKEAMEIVKLKIDAGLIQNKKYAYEYQENQFMEAEDPDWLTD